MSAPEVEQGPTTTLKPLERIVLGDQLPDLDLPPAGSMYNPNERLEGTGKCGAFLRSGLDARFWRSEGDVFTEMLRPLNDRRTDEVAARLAATSDVMGAEVAQAFHDIDALVMSICGLPGGGALFAISLSTGGSTYPDAYPCLTATGAAWPDISQGQLPWVSTDCETGELVAWDSEANRWASPQLSPQEQFDAVDEALS